MALFRFVRRGDDGAVVPAPQLSDSPDSPRRGRRLDLASVGLGSVVVLRLVAVAVAAVIAVTGLFTSDPEQRAYALAVVLGVLDVVRAGLGCAGQ